MTAADILKKHTCEIVEDLLPLYAEDRIKHSGAMKENNIDAPASAFVEEHLKNCPDCRSLLEMIQEDFSGTDFPPPDIPPLHFRRKYHIRLVSGTACAIIAAIGILAILL